MVFDNSPASPESLPDFVDQKPHFGASKWRVVQWRKTLILMTLPKKAVFFFAKKFAKTEPKSFFSAYCNCEYFDRKGGCLQ